MARAPAVWGIGRLADGRNPFASIEPRISANLSNQFEWPLFFYAACLLLLQSETAELSILLAWIFVLGRVVHSLVQILTTNVSISWRCWDSGRWFSGGKRDGIRSIHR